LLKSGLRLLLVGRSDQRCCEFYSGPCSGLVDATPLTFEQLDLDGRTGFTGRLLAEVVIEVGDLLVGDSDTCSSTTKGYTFRVTRVL